ncbi:MAG: hypothetical protein KGL95_01880, partial [Patescibacteria group bacterium]|nr:hypothetical protein [Patescibacteria group bacterium]
MTDKEKDTYSARRLALDEMKKYPVKLQIPIFSLQEPSEFQIGRIRKEELVKNNKALQFAFGLESLEAAHVTPNPALSVKSYAPFSLVTYHNGAVREYKINPKTASMGLVLLSEVDLKTVPDGENKRSIRLQVNETGNPTLCQMGPQALQVVLASRAAEYLDMHSAEMHQHVRDLISGKIPHVGRSNTPSPVLEGILGMILHTDAVSGKRITYRAANVAIATKELGYKRLSFTGELSRKQAAKGLLMLGPDGVVSSLYSYGGMPPTTGSRDNIVTAAMSYMRCWISRNGVFAGNFQRQLLLFKEAKNKIESFHLPKDIENQVVSQIGTAVGCDNPKKIADQMLLFQKAGGHAARI